MLVRLRVRDWGPFQERTVEFEPGRNLIYGKNHTGKTALLNAIFYALTGDVLAPKAKGRDFVRADSRESIVELDFVAGEPYRVRRRPKQRQSHLMRLEGGREVTEMASGSDVDSLIAELLGLEMPEMTQAVFMKEGAIAEYLSESTPGKRKKFIKSLVNLDRLEEISGAASDWKKEVYRRAREAKKDAVGVRKRVTNLKSKPIVGEKARLEGRIRNLEAQKEMLIEKKGSLEEASDSLVKLESKEQKLRNVRDRQQMLQGKLGTEKGPYASIDEIEKEARSIEVASEDLEAKRKAEEEALTTKNHVEGRKNSIQNELDSVESLKKREAKECPTCHQEITPQILHSIIRDKERDLKGVQDELEQAESRYQARKKKTKDVRKSLEKKRELQNKAESIRKLKDELEELEQEISSLDDEIQELERKSEGASKVHGLENEIRDMDKELQEAKDQRDEAIAHESAVKEAKNRLDSLEEKEEELKHKKAVAKVLAKACEETIVELGSIPLKKVEQIAGGSISDLGIFPGWHLDLESKNMLPIAETDQETVKAPTMAASEKMLCFLALRMALVRSMIGSDFMALDEPTEHLDTEHVERVRDFLGCADEPEQVIVTSNSEVLAGGEWDKAITL